MNAPPTSLDGLCLHRVSVHLDGIEIVREVSLRVRSGGWTSLIGPNGAGKSTLLRALAGATAFDGEIVVDGGSVAGLSPRQRARLVGYAPQSPTMPADMTVFDYALLGRTPHLKYFASEGASDRTITANVLRRLDLEEFQARRLGSLSGGERQRVVIARAMVSRPAVLVLDEPTTSLDLGHQQQVLELVDELRRDSGITVLTSLHDLDLAAAYADELVVLSGGERVASGPPEQVLTADLVLQYYGARVELGRTEDGRVSVHLVRPDRTPTTPQP